MPHRPLASYQHPITGNQALLEADLTLMSPKLDEPHTQTVQVTQHMPVYTCTHILVTCTDTHTHTHADKPLQYCSRD